MSWKYSADCEQRARECLALAERVPKVLRPALLELADSWRRIATEIEIDPDDPSPKRLQ